MSRKYSYFTILSATLVVLSLTTGCAWFSKPTGMNAADRFIPGVTTLKQATAVLGRPQSLSNSANGQLIVGWLHQETTTTGVAPRGITLLFDRDGRMLQVIHKYEERVGY